MRCSKCGTESRSGRRFCPECGSPLAHRCAKCGAENSPAAKFCEDCGASLGSQAAASTRTAAAPPLPTIEPAGKESSDGERKIVTALFADIKGSMELMEDRDPEEARAIVDPALKLMMDAVHRYGGYVAQSTGDGIFAVFGAPVAHEDHPQRAVYSGLRIQDEMRRYSAKLRQAGNPPLEARVGVNTGEVVVRTIATGDGHVEYTPIGHSISLAARIQTLAPTGSVVITEGTRHLIEGYFSVKPLGPTRIKGVSEAIEVFEVGGLGPLRTRLQRSASRGYTKFVGRQREMEALKQSAELARSGRGQIVAAMADAGVGKSRLFFEFKAKSQSGWLVLETISVSHGKATAYLPLIEMLQDYFRIISSDDASTRREKVAGKLAMLDRSLEEESLPHLFALLGIADGQDPLAQVRRRRVHEVVKRILLRESVNRPLMLIFEDLHWIDEETEAFLNLLGEAIANAPILLLVNYRPEYSHRWSSKTYYTQLRLDPLGMESAEEMLSSLLGDGEELKPLGRIIIEKAEGNPLFIEEIFQALLEDGSLKRNGSVKVIRPVEQLRLPPTVQGILAARIDRLRPEEKNLLQTLAVIGSEFPLALVREVVPLPDDRLDFLLEGLQTGEFIYEQPAANDVEYKFKHALTHDIAYKSLLTERRRLLHERAAEAIEALYCRRLEDHYANLAHHFVSSSNPAKAVEYLRLAGEQLIDRGAYLLAIANVEPALRSVQQLPEPGEQLRAELGVRLMEGRAVTVLYGIGSAQREHAFERVCELGEQLGDNSAQIRGLINIGFAYANRGEAQRARDMAGRGLALVRKSRNNEALSQAQMLASWCDYGMGNLLEASSGFSDRMGRVDSATRPTAGFVVEPWVITPVMLALVCLTLGRPDESLKLIDEALRRARELKHPFMLVTALATASTLRYFRREPDETIKASDAIIALAEQCGFSERLAQGRAQRGWALCELGQVEPGFAELEATRDSPTIYFFPAEMMLLQARIRARQSENLLETLEEALTRVKRCGAHVAEPELCRLKSEAILLRDPAAFGEAETHLRKATEIAKGQSAKWWELRATVNLARLLANTARREEARAMLTEIYGWFTEGFDTVDLKDAKTLLEELSN